MSANHPNTGGVKSYPNATRYVGKKLSALHSVSSSFNVSVPSSGAYETAYDVWDTNNAYEIMLWMNKTGAVGPLGTSQGTVTVGGSTWTVYKGSNGANAVFSFVRTSNTSSSTVDVLAVLNWLKNTKGWFGDITLGNVQFGYEITSSAAWPELHDELVLRVLVLTGDRNAGRRPPAPRRAPPGARSRRRDVACDPVGRAARSATARPRGVRASGARGSRSAPRSTAGDPGAAPRHLHRRPSRALRCSRSLAAPPVRA